MNNKYERKNRIAEALSLRNMKAVELSERTGISKSSLSSYISNRWQPKQEALYKMARVLEVSEMWLAGYDVQMERPVEQVRADELAQIVHRLRKDKNMKSLVSSICKLNDDQLSIVENMVNEFNKINHQE
jgi:ribosome-binding protein aMBF1 (putative translation factor)